VRRGDGEGAMATFSHDMQGAGNMLCFKFVNILQGNNFERLQCSLHDPAGPAFAPALQERSKARHHVHMV
jgi:hypothetical protein